MSARAVVFAVIVMAAGCRRHETAATAERAVLERREQGLAALVTAARRGTLVPFDKMLVVADERLVRDVIAASLPFERVISARYRIRIERAEVHFEDGLGLVRLEGQATFADRAPDQGRADVAVYGGLDVVELDPASGTLRGRVSVIAVDARRVDVLGMASHLAEDLVEDLGREKLDAYGDLVSRVDIPVRLERSVSLPAVGPAEVSIDAATIPLRVAISDVKAFQGKLWVSVDVAAEGAQ